MLIIIGSPQEALYNKYVKSIIVMQVITNKVLNNNRLLEYIRLMIG